MRHKARSLDTGSPQDPDRERGIFEGVLQAVFLPPVEMPKSSRRTALISAARDL
jgi:hypothetical protein